MEQRTINVIGYGMVAAAVFGAVTIVSVTKFRAGAAEREANREREQTIAAERLSRERARAAQEEADARKRGAEAAEAAKAEAAMPPPDPLATAKTVTDAAKIIRLGDADNTVDPGWAALAVWASKHASWEDFFVATDETTFGKVMKDSDEERGKRVCWGGSIIQISVESVDGNKIANGLMLTSGANVVKFAAVGSSGDLVQNSPARICGIVTGQYHYDNSGGGRGHAVSLVGMFDLPKNRAIGRH